MKFGKTLLFFLLFASAAIGIRWAVFGRGEPSKPLKTEGMAVSVDSGVESPNVRPTVEPVVKVVDKAKPTPVLRVVGYVMRGERVNLWLSDGRFLTERDAELQEIRKNYAVIDGQRVWFQAPYRASVSEGDAQRAPLLWAGGSGGADSLGTGPKRAAEDAPKVVSSL